MVRENFCGFCLAVPLVLGGGAATGYSYSGKEYRKKRGIMILGAVISILSILFIYYYFKKCKTCFKK